MARRLPHRALALIASTAIPLGLAAACSSPEPSQSETVSRTITTPTPRSTAGRPTVVLVHGAWADTSSWSGVTKSLLAQRYAVRAIANPLENLTTDAGSVADFLASLTGPIVLVGHSYGGAVISSVAAGNPNVKALVYVDAAAPAIGEMNSSLSGTNSVLNRKPKAELFDLVPSAGAPEGAADLLLQRRVFVQNFGNDLPRDRAVRLWASQRAASTDAFDTPAQQAAWKTIPSWYFISRGDQIITPASQKAMARRAHSRITVFPGGSHLTLISHPDAVTKVIKAAIDSVR